MKNIVQELNLTQYISAADSTLAAMNFTEHNLAHVSRVAKMCCKILKELDYDEHTIELAEIACYMHDIGNVINRYDHAHSGALMAYNILLSHNFELHDILQIMSAIGNHDETTGSPVSPMSAALIIADKADVRRSRVRNQDVNTFGIHDRVNYAVNSSHIVVNKEDSLITLKLELNPKYSSVFEYYEIFYGRMKLCKQAANFLNMNFCLQINDVTLMD